MSIERLLYLEDTKHIDFSIDPTITSRVEELLGYQAKQAESNRERARRWIHSPVKEALDRAVIGLSGSIFTTPFSLIAMAGVVITNGFPPTHNLEVGFLGENNSIICQARYPKVRTLRLDVDRLEEKQPLTATIFRGGRRQPESDKDPRAHSRWGMFLRRTSVDELLQLWSILLGQIAGVGPRGYDSSELAGLSFLFSQEDQNHHFFPSGYLENYRQAISFSQPKPGLFSLSSATRRKDLTVTERLYTDYLHVSLANLFAEFRIIAASLSVISKGIGAR